MSGTWGAVVRGWRAHVPAVAVGAAAQAALVAGDPEPGASGVFALLVGASVVVLVTSVAVVAGGALAAVDKTPFRIPGALWLWSVVCVIVAFGASLLAAPLVPLAVGFALLVLPAAADGYVNPFSHAFAVFRSGALRTIAALVAALALLLVSWLAALLLGFFVTGPLASALTWLWFGVTGVVLLTWFTVRYRRRTPA